VRTARLLSEVLNSSEVHLWAARLLATPSQIDYFYRTLSNDERRRVEAFRFEKHKHAFVLARGLLRRILGWYLGRESEHIRFEYGPHGKPALCKGQKPNLHFNLAHSDDRVLYAFTQDCEVGVDLELVRELPEARSVAEHFFPNEERTDLFRIAPESRSEAFFNCWCRKEAYLKATGQGLSVPLDSFQVSAAPGQPATLLKLGEDRVHDSPWTLFHLTPVTGYVGALAIRSRACVLRERLFETTDACLNFLETSKP
jgi:4'-phosphopantetheinyl transferase